MPLTGISVVVWKRVVGSKQTEKRTEAFTVKTDAWQTVCWVKPKLFFNKIAAGNWQNL